ncbi:MAG: hypothetical protein HYV07_25145 [Deltaproteobacteria bacterium]|nr:hypothetical protein [Deltaproteobacteria bacterium]
MMLTIDPATGTLRMDGFRQDVTPGLDYATFASSDLGRASTVLFPDRGYGDWTVELPVTVTGEARVHVMLSFIRDRLGSVCLVPLFPGEAADFYSTSDDPWQLERQRVWLATHVGVKDGGYSWGSVWSRDNINARRFDVGISFFPDREDRGMSAPAKTRRRRSRDP